METTHKKKAFLTESFNLFIPRHVARRPEIYLVHCYPSDVRYVTAIAFFSNGGDDCRNRQSGGGLAKTPSHIYELINNHPNQPLLLAGSAKLQYPIREWLPSRQDECHVSQTHSCPLSKE